MHYNSNNSFAQLFQIERSLFEILFSFSAQTFCRSRKRFLQLSLWIFLSKGIRNLPFLLYTIDRLLENTSFHTCIGISRLWIHFFFCLKNLKSVCFRFFHQFGIFYSVFSIQCCVFYNKSELWSVGLLESGPLGGCLCCDSRPAILLF